MLLTEKIGALPVVDGEQLVGIVTESDFVRAFVDETSLRP
jgi:CBS domain-containing protein